LSYLLSKCGYFCPFLKKSIKIVNYGNFVVDHFGLKSSIYWSKLINIYSILTTYYHTINSGKSFFKK